MKTQRMEPQDAQDALAAFKVFDTERASELKINHEGDEACNSRISEMRFWRNYNLKSQKQFFEFLCPFRPGKQYHTSSTSSPFTVMIITDLKQSYFISFYRLLLLCKQEQIWTLVRYLQHDEYSKFIPYLFVQSKRMCQK